MTVSDPMTGVTGVTGVTEVTGATMSDRERSDVTGGRVRGRRRKIVM